MAECVLSVNDTYVIVEMIKGIKERKNQLEDFKTLYNKLACWDATSIRMLKVDIVLEIVNICSQLGIDRLAADYIVEAKEMLERVSLSYRINEIYKAAQSICKIAINYNVIRKYEEIYGGKAKREYWEENYYAFSLGDVIKERRAIFNLSVSDLCGEHCAYSTLYRIEDGQIEPKDKLRRHLFDKLGLSGEEYECQIITTIPEDISRASQYVNIFRGKYSDEDKKQYYKWEPRLKNVITNRQYVAYINSLFCDDCTKEKQVALWDALRITLPIEGELKQQPITVLTINEIRILTELACQYILKGMFEAAEDVVRFIKKSIHRENLKLYRNESYLFALSRLDDACKAMGISNNKMAEKMFYAQKIHFKLELLKD